MSFDPCEIEVIWHKPDVLVLWFRTSDFSAAMSPAEARELAAAIEDALDQREGATPA